MDIYQVIRKPLVTAKSYSAQSENGVYAFEVDRRASKDDVRKAVEKLFGVNVLSVRTLLVRGKEKRFGRFVGQRVNWKKAYVKVAAGQTISVFEG